MSVENTNNAESKLETVNKQLQPLVGKYFLHKEMKGEIHKVEALSDTEVAIFITLRGGGVGLCKVVVMFWGDIVPVKCEDVSQKNYSVGNFLLDARIDEEDCVKAVASLL